MVQIDCLAALLCLTKYFILGGPARVHLYFGDEEYFKVVKYSTGMKLTLMLAEMSRLAGWREHKKILINW